MKNEIADITDFQFLFQSVPGLYLVLLPDLTISAVSDAYLEATMTKRNEIVNKNLFEVFPDNPNDPEADGVSNLRSSLEKVIKYKRPHQMQIQKYDISRPDGVFEARYWSPLNKPVLDDSDELVYIIHSVQDITHKKESEERIKEVNKQLERSNELFLKLFDLNPGAISISKLSDLTLYNVNESFLELFGFENKEDVIGRTAEELNILPDSSVRQRVMEGVRKDGRVSSLEGKVRTKNGIDKWVSVSVQMVQINDDPYLLTVTLDISHRKEQEDFVKKQSEKLRSVNEELQSSNELFSKLFDLNPASIAISRLQDATLLSVNQAFLDMFEFENRNDVLDKTAEQLQILVNASQRPMVIEELLQNKRVVNVEDKYQTRNKVVKWATNSIQLIDIAGTPCLLSVMIDISKRKEQETLLERQREELSLVNQELESFSYSVSHDLKAPLRSLQGFSKALFENYNGKFDENADRWLKFIEMNARRMDHLIQDILEFSKVSRTDLKVSEVNMQQKVLDIIRTEQLSYPNKIVNFEVNNLPGCKGDIAMLRQVWQNLVSNAFKYSSKNNEIKIAVNSWRENNFLIYSISDNGVGFDDKYKDKLFGVFQRLHSNDEFDGTGVGLAIVNRIVQKHGGWISASSEIGKGSEFKFGLPTKIEII